MTITQAQAHRLKVGGIHGTPLCYVSHVNDLYVITFEDGSTEVILDFEDLPRATEGFYCIIKPFSRHTAEAVREHISAKEYNQLLTVLEAIEKYQ